MSSPLPERINAGEATDNCVSALTVPSEGQSLYLVTNAPHRSPLFASHGALARYGVAILSVVASLLLRQLLYPLLGQQDTYLTVFTAVVFASWYCGFGPAIL
jgi:hypothetical protein